MNQFRLKDEQQVFLARKMKGELRAYVKSFVDRNPTLMLSTLMYVIADYLTTLAVGKMVRSTDTKLTEEDVDHLNVVPFNVLDRLHLDVRKNSPE